MYAPAIDQTPLDWALLGLARLVEELDGPIAHDDGHRCNAVPR
jgi:hypothetical protein